MKIPRVAVKTGPASPGSIGLTNGPSAYATPTPFATPVSVTSAPPLTGSGGVGGTSTVSASGIASAKFVVTPVGLRPMAPALLPIGIGPNCAVAGALLQCTLVAPLTPGNYTAAISIYGGANGTGPLLGPVQSVAFTVGSQRQNVVPLAIGGIPDGLTVAGAAFAVHSAPNNGFTIVGESAQPFVVSVQDALGDTVVGPGAPTFTVNASSTSGGAWQANAPTPQSPNTFTIDPPSTNSTASVTVTAQYSDGTCSQSSAVCSVTFPVANDLQLLFVANCTGSCNSKSSSGVPGSVTMYAPPYTGAPTATILNGVVQPIALLTDASLNLYVANAFGGASNAGSVTIYAPPYTGTPATIATGIDNPGALALDPSGNLWVANQAGRGLNGSVAEYAPPFGGGPVRTISSFAGVPTSIAFDPQGNLFLANGSSLLEYAAPYNGPPATVITGLSVANGFSFDASSNLYYVDSTGAVEVFSPPYSEQPMQLQRVSGSLGLLATFQTGGMIFVPDASGNLQQYVAPFTGPPQGIAQSSSAAKGVAVDGAGNVFVGYCGSGCGNSGSDSVTVYPPPYAGSQTSITSGVAAPSAITLSR